jgi:hypothetical protein
LAKCSGITRAGTACKGMPIDDSQWCYAHHPDHAHERRRHGARGGKRGGRARPQTELAALKAEVRAVIEEVRSGDLDKGVGAVLGQLYNVLLKAMSVGLDVEERLELLTRMEALEEALASRKDRGGSYGA